MNEKQEKQLLKIYREIFRMVDKAEDYGYESVDDILNPDLCRVKHDLFDLCEDLNLKVR